MSAAARGWEPCEVTVNAATETGTVVPVHRVRAERNAETGEVRVEPLEVLRAQFRDIVDEAGLQEGRDLPLLAILAAHAGNLPVQLVSRKYSLNKMLFYQWKRLEEQGLGESFPHDEFVADRKGPVPKHIDDDLERLSAAGLVSIDKPTGRDHKPWIINLTPEGQRVANTILMRSEPWFKQVTTEVKTDIFPLDPERLRRRVHTEYPEYKRKYVEVDSS